MPEPLWRWLVSYADTSTAQQAPDGYRMSSFKFFWTTHKWTGIVIAILLVMSSVTGFLLLIKKDFDWIQPPTATATEGTIDDFAPIQTVVATIIAQDHPDFQTPDDIDRIDTRPEKRLHKIRSRHHYTEYQVDAITAQIVSGPDRRMSDLLESIHDGSFFADWFHDWIMPIVPISILLLVFSGFWLWLQPKFRRARRRRTTHSTS
ncbi:MAG: hypothetical protein CMJ40_10895 [Phycisphaerae bacterium]|nr:hypothetical protein [Phycisphaerae bacterium]|tara:strand:+ start:564 stop:1178 length:615 start_codon:yes stop_codon:yes gene_type:complete